MEFWINVIFCSTLYFKTTYDIILAPKFWTTSCFTSKFSIKQKKMLGEYFDTSVSELKEHIICLYLENVCNLQNLQVLVTLILYVNNY